MPEIKDNIFETNYKHVISLGFFCSVALELERKGVRDASYPFDWLISDFQGVIKVIENRFYDFLNIDFFLRIKSVCIYSKIVNIILSSIMILRHINHWGIKLIW